MAVIKPLTNTYQNTALEFSDLSTKTLYNVAEEDEGDPVRYSPPMVALGQMPACGLIKEVGEEEVELYSPEHLQKNIPQRAEEVVVAALSGGVPVYHQAHLLQRDPFAEEPASPSEEELESERFGLLQGYMFNNAQIHNNEEEELAEARSAMEDSLALMPPSPFRDHCGPPTRPFPNSPVSESILCSPPHVTYATVILKDFKQSSSTL